MSSSSILLLYLSASADQMLSTRIEEAFLASCKSTTGGCSGREEEERGVDRDKELDVGVDANRRRFAGGTPSLKVRIGEDAKDWEREESGGVTKDFVNFGGGFEVEALAFIAQGDGLNKSRLADHMVQSEIHASHSRLRISYPLGLYFFNRYCSLPLLPLCKMAETILGGGRRASELFFHIDAGRRHLPNLDDYCSHPPAIESGQ